VFGRAIALKAHCRSGVIIARQDSEGGRVGNNESYKHVRNVLDSTLTL